MAILEIVGVSNGSQLASRESVRLVLVLFLAACGATSQSPTASLPSDGSYDLVVSAGKNDPSDGVHARLDVDGGRAVVTPAFGASVETTATRVGDRLVVDLAGSNVVISKYEDWDTWTRLELELGPSGFGGKAVVTGMAHRISADSISQFALTATGVIAPDATPPSVRLDDTASADGAYLPWDTLSVTASEPIEKTRFATNVAAKVGGASLAFEPKATTSVGATTFLASFDPESAGAGTVTVGALADRSGNVGASQSFPFSVVALPSPMPTLDLDADLSAVATWGSVSHASGADCESGGCAKIAFKTPQCTPLERAAGLAARVATGAKELRFRARYVSDLKLGGLSSPTFGLYVESGRGPSFARTDVPLATLDAAWKTVIVPLASDAVGFTLRAGVSYACGPYPIPSGVTVWVDAIEVL
jgi:hypothetical protein